MVTSVVFVEIFVLEGLTTLHHPLCPTLFWALYTSVVARHDLSPTGRGWTRHPARLVSGRQGRWTGLPTRRGWTRRRCRGGGGGGTLVTVVSLVKVDCGPGHFVQSESPSTLHGHDTGVGYTKTSKRMEGGTTSVDV